MSIFSLIYLFCTIVYLYLSAYILYKNPKSLVNRTCVAFLFCLVIWCFPLAFLTTPYVTKNVARTAINISSLGWCSFSSFFLWFILVFSGKTDILKKKWFYPLIFIIPAIFIYKQWTNELLDSYKMFSFGWKPLWSHTIWPHLYYIYYLSFMGIAFFINLQFIRNARDTKLKKQGMIIFVTLLVAVVSGTVTDVILPLMNINSLPNMAIVFTLIYAVGMVISISKYQFLAITPATAADNIISTMYDCLILLNMEGRIITINKSTSSLLGYQEDQLKGKPVSTLFKKEDFTDLLIKKLLEDGELINEDRIFKTRLGTEIPILFSGSILKDDSGIPAGIVCVAKNITERKKLEELIFKGKKMESIGLFVGGIAHDFNNLLSIILGNLSMLKSETSADEMSHKFLVNIEEASLKVMGLVRKYMTFAPGQGLRKQKLHLADLFINAQDWKLLKKEIDITFDIKFPEDLAPIYGDENELLRVMQNLILNAVEIIEENPPKNGGRISVRASNTVVEDSKEVKYENTFLLKKGQYVKVLIKDNGAGISNENIEKIFDPYFSTKDRFAKKGMGLGLTLCYSIIKKHDGHLEVNSQEGKGTTVTLFIPVAMEAIT